MITIGVALAAFVIAFVAGKAGGGGSEASAAPVGKTLSAPAAVPVTAGVSAKSVPELKVVKKKKPKKSAPKSTATAAPAPSNPTPSVTAAPSAPSPSAPAPSNPAPNPAPSNPAPAPTPVTGGGET
jgi:hypothetical protein